MHGDPYAYLFGTHFKLTRKFRKQRHQQYSRVHSICALQVQEDACMSDTLHGPVATGAVSTEADAVTGSSTQFETQSPVATVEIHESDRRASA